MQDEEHQRKAFHSVIGALVDEYAWFDYNLGLQLRYWAKEKAVDVLHARFPLQVRLDRLKELVRDCSPNADPLAIERWQAWLEQVQQIRVLRNDYAHSRLVRQQDGWRLAPLQWSGGTEECRDLIAVTLSDLELQAQQIVKVLREMSDVVGAVLSPRGR